MKLEIRAGHGNARRSRAWARAVVLPDVHHGNKYGNVVKATCIVTMATWQPHGSVVMAKSNLSMREIA